MKKLHILALFALFVGSIHAGDEGAQSREDFLAAKVATDERTPEQKSAYLQSKQAKADFRPETPEFRFALKLAEYRNDLENGDMTQEDFNTIIDRKIKTYFSNDASKIAGESFIHEYLSLPLAELKTLVGTKDTLGTMQRFVDQKNS